MSAHPQYLYTQGDEYLPDMLHRHQDAHYYRVPSTDGLARDLSRLSSGTDSSRHWSARSGEDTLSRPANSNAGSSTSKNSSSGTTNSSSSKSSLDSSRALRNSAANDRQRQLGTLPNQFMLDRWLGQRTGQDPFHGLAGATGHRDHFERR